MGMQMPIMLPLPPMLITAFMMRLAHGSIGICVRKHLNDFKAKNDRKKTCREVL